MREPMDSPGFAYEERGRAGKMLGEGHVGKLHLVRAQLAEARLVELHGRRLWASRRGHQLLAGPTGEFQASLFRITFWHVSRNLFGKGECGSWPRQRIDEALWARSAPGERLRQTPVLMKLAVLPDEAVERNAAWVARVLSAWRVLRPLVVRSRRVCRGRRGSSGCELAQEHTVRPVPPVRCRTREDRGATALTRTPADGGAAAGALSDRSAVFDQRPRVSLQLTEMKHIISPALEPFPTNLPTWTDGWTVGESALARGSDT